MWSNVVSLLLCKIWAVIYTRLKCNVGVFISIFVTDYSTNFVKVQKQNCCLHDCHTILYHTCVTILFTSCNNKFKTIFLLRGPGEESRTSSGEIGISVWSVSNVPSGLSSDCCWVWAKWDWVPGTHYAYQWK